jgi:hypothetical protein
MGFLLGALVGGVLFFNSQATPHRAEREVEKALQSRFPGAHIDAEIKGKRGFDVIKGRFKQVRVQMAQFDLAGGGTGVGLQAVPSAKKQGRLGRTEIQLRDFEWQDLKVDAVDLNVQELVYDWDALKNESQLKIVSCGPVTARLVIPATSLTAAIAPRIKDVQNARIALKDGQVHITGTRAMPLVGGVNFLLTAKLQARNGNEIWLTEPRVAAAGMPGLSLPADALLRDINPIYVFDREKAWPFRVQIQNITTINDKLDLSGNLVFVPAVAAPAGATPAPAVIAPGVQTPAPATS